MNENSWLAERFEANRPHLRGVAYRILGSLSEADDAVQESWLKLSRSGTEGVENLGGWMTTVVARVCLDMLRSRKSRREDLHGVQVPDQILNSPGGLDPEQEALMAESVGLAFLVVLERLEPAERLAFVLHDLFGVAFEEIAPIVGRTVPAARQLASRARRRVHGAATHDDPDFASQRDTVNAFLTALRNADFEGLLAVLDPHVVVRAETPEGIREIRGARNWAKGAIAFSQQARVVQPALVDGKVGLLFAPYGRLSRAVRFTIRNSKITEVDLISEPDHLRDLDLATLSE